MGAKKKAGKLRRNGVEQERRKARYNVDFLKDPTTAEVALVNRFKGVTLRTQ